MTCGGAGQAEDRHGTRHIRETETDRGACVRYHQRGHGLPTVPPARTGKCHRGVEPGVPCLQRETAFQPQPRLTSASEGAHPTRTGPEALSVSSRAGREGRDSRRRNSTRNSARGRNARHRCPRITRKNTETGTSSQPRKTRMQAKHDSRDERHSSHHEYEEHEGGGVHRCAASLECCGLPACSAGPR